MALNASALPSKAAANRVEQPLIDAGVYPARIVQIIDLGLQAQRPFQGKEKAPAPEIMLTYELVDSFMIDKDGNELEDKPRWISETLPLYPLSQEKAKSSQRYVAADPNNVFGGDFAQLLNTPVNVTLVHNKSGDKVYVNVAGIASMRKKDAEKLVELKNPTKLFDLDDPDLEVFKALPEWIQDKIKKNLKYNGSKLQAALGGKPVKEEVVEVEEPPIPADNGQDAPWD